MQRCRRRRSLATIEPPTGDAKIAQVLVRSPPPGACLGPGEIDQPLAFLVYRDGRIRLDLPRIGDIQQIAGAFSLLE